MYNATANDDATVGVILNRRDAMMAAARAGVGLVAAGAFFGRPVRASVPATLRVANLMVSPALTEGPYFVNRQLERSDLTAGTERAAVVQGTPLELTFVVQRLDGTVVSPMRGAQVDVWQADAHGVYSAEDHSTIPRRTGSASRQWLRGYQLADELGRVHFRTIIPGAYEGRSAHVHLKVRRFSPAGNVTAEFTSQLFFQDGLLADVYRTGPYVARGGHHLPNSQDPIFNERQPDGSVAGKWLTLSLEKTPQGYSSQFSLILTDDVMKPGAERFGAGAREPRW
jgi:protocatechuate 3,4-dioxygenase beta subunit